MVVKSVGIRSALCWIVGMGLVGLSAGSVEGAPPPNDSYGAAVVVGALPYSVTADVREATSGAEFTRCGYLDQTVWYAFTPDSAFLLDATAAGNDGSYTVLVAFAGTPDRSTEVGCATSGPVGPAAFKFPVSAGVTYYFVLGTVALSPGGAPSFIDFSLAQGPPPPDNDEIEGARAITSLPLADQLDTAAATTAADDPYCYGYGATVWYSLTLPSDTRVELNTFGSDYGATLSVYTGERGSLTQLACSAFSTGPGARVRFDAQANVTYHVMAGSYSTEGGQLVLAAGLAPPPFTLEIQLDRKGSVVPSTGAVTVRGTATCSEPVFVSTSGALWQERPGLVLGGYFSTSFFCEGTTAWSAEVISPLGLFSGRSAALFVGGRADAEASASAYSPSEGEFRFVTTRRGITLSGAKP